MSSYRPPQHQPHGATFARDARYNDAQQHLGAQVASMLQDGYVLEAKEDIYAAGRNGALLLRAGTRVEPLQLAKLLRFGVQPTQFIIKEESASGSEQLTSNALWELDVIKEGTATQQSPDKPPIVKAVPAKNPEPGMSIPFHHGGPSPLRHCPHHIVVYEPDERQLKRLMSILNGLGIPMSRIHPVRVFEQMASAVQAFKPGIIFVDTPLEPVSGYWQSLGLWQDLPCVKQIITMLPGSCLHNVDSSKSIMQRLEKYDTTVCCKPLNRFQILTLLKLTVLDAVFSSAALS